VPASQAFTLLGEHDDLFRHHCWRILEANARFGDSHQIARASCELIRQSLALVQTVSPQLTADETPLQSAAVLAFRPAVSRDPTLAST
jgi:hypothetical protein